MLHKPKGNQPIDEMITYLRNNGATGVDEYYENIKNNAKNPGKLEDFLFEGRAALMFLYRGFQVHLRNKPDLQIILGKDIIFVEVKHFHEKRQDINDKEAMSKVNDVFCLYGDTTPTEGVAAWKQIANVAVKKPKRINIWKDTLTFL